MALPIVLKPGSHSAIGANLPLARVAWHEPPASGGTATVRDGNGVVLATITYAGRGKGPEPAAVVFNPPLVVTAGVIHASAPGGWLQVHIQGASGFGY
jgi:hypothetical protein